MDTNGSAARYSRGAIILHWLIALLIIGNIIGAWIAEDMARDQRMAVMALHKATGIVILFLSLVRLGWRFTHRPPPLLESLKAWEAALAKVVHTLFYVLMIGIPLSGWALHSAFSGGKPVSIYGLFDMPALPVTHGRTAGGQFGEIHELGATLLLGLLALHLAGALKHQFVDRDGTMRRMVPFLR